MGELWASALIGGIVGGIIGGVSSAVNDYIMGRPVTLASVAKGAVSGFLTGAISNMLPTKKNFHGGFNNWEWHKRFCNGKDLWCKCKRIVAICNDSSNFYIFIIQIGEKHDWQGS